MLARLRLPPAAIKEAIVRLDDIALSVDNLKAIKHYVPSEDEASSRTGRPTVC